MTFDTKTVETPPVATAPAETAPVIAPVVEATEAPAEDSIVVNGRTYKSVKEVAKKIENADSHIDTLEEEARTKDATMLEMIEKIQGLQNLESEVREKDAKMLELIEKIQGIEGKLDDKASIEDLVAKMETSVEPAPTPEPSLEVQEISKDELIEAAKDSIKQETLELQQESNLAAALQAAAKKFGDGYQEKVVAKAAEVGMKPAQVDQMARLSPAAFTKLFIGTDAELKSLSSKGSITSETLGLTEQKVKTERFMKMSAKKRSDYIKSYLTEATKGA